MVRDGYKFDEEQVQNASVFLHSITSLPNLSVNFDTVLKDVLKAIERDSPVPTPEFVDSMTVLISSPHPSIIQDSLDTFIARSLDCVLLPSNPVHSLYYTPDTDPDSIRDVVLPEVIIPIEPSLVQISRNPHLLSWIKEYKTNLQLLLTLLNISPLHQPTLDFICSSPIPMVFPSLLSKVEDNDTHQFIIKLMSSHLRRWKTHGTDTERRGRIVLQTLEQEGFRDHLELTLHHNKSSMYGKKVRRFSFEILNDFGINCRHGFGW
ncbi:hypothetical protein BLNAU_3147 [Blattamonas nauphoetae]|uniref:CCR4-NOT transcription complex subunit 11 n=1 Tax=Blattamonas nauphoetae TaxID=2049346 RepID=A0ABQ9YDB6_9EUKA|nr:hypothetical protein BLNAU_3147 [Blattamonas nauphoetae]